MRHLQIETLKQLLQNNPCAGVFDRFRSNIFPASAFLLPSPRNSDNLRSPCVCVSVCRAVNDLLIATPLAAVQTEMLPRVSQTHTLASNFILFWQDATLAHALNRQLDIVASPCCCSSWPARIQICTVLPSWL